MIIRFQLIKSLIIEAAEETTYLKGQIDKHAQDGSSNQALIANETAGEEALSKRIFEHDFHTALELLKTIFVEHLSATAQTIGDNAIYYNDKTDDIVEFSLEVSRRYNGSLTDTLARLCAKYTEDYIIQQWWLKTTNLKQAEPYANMLQEDALNIRKCFVLSAPLYPRFPTPSLSRPRLTEATRMVLLRLPSTTRARCFPIASTMVLSTTSRHAAATRVSWRFTDAMSLTAFG